jgi:hypothetical protein
MEKPDLFIAIPCYDAMQCETVEALLRADRELPFPHVIRLHCGESLVTRARNRLASEFIKGNWTHLLFIDSDIIFTPEHITRLLSHGEDLVGGHYALKSNAFWGCVSTLHDDVKQDERGLIGVRGAGTGFLSIGRNVLERMIEALGAELEYEQYDNEGGGKAWDFFGVGVRHEPRGKHDVKRYYSEDWMFCARARELGFKVYLDAHVVLGHIGRINYPLPCSREHLISQGWGYGRRNIHRSSGEIISAPLVPPMAIT